jgi:hypothetical protein
MPLELKAVADFIGAVGFPVFVAVVMMWTTWGLHRENRADLHELASAMKDICEVLHTLVNQNRRQG